MNVERDAHTCRLEMPFTIILDDCSGNSHIESARLTHGDAHKITVHYARTHEQEQLLGFVADDAEASTSPTTEALQAENLANEVLHFDTPCSNCSKPAETNMKVVGECSSMQSCHACSTDIPHFKQVVLMCSSCNECGFKETEAKSGAGVAPQGVRYTLSIREKGVSIMDAHCCMHIVCRGHVP